MNSLKLKDILLKYYEQTVLKIDEFCAEDSFAIIGCSGSGKSNFLKVIAGLEEIESGYIYMDDDECGDKKPKDRRISLISARTPLFENKSAYYNLVYPLKKRKLSKIEIAKMVEEAVKHLRPVADFEEAFKDKNDENFDGTFIDLDQNVFTLQFAYQSAVKDGDEACQVSDSHYSGNLIDKTHTNHKSEPLNNDLKIDLKRKVKNLSASQKSALIFARAMIKNPRLLLLDEPGEIVGDMPLLLRLLKKSNCFFVLATYDFDLAVKAANHFVILKQGDIIFNGDFQALKNSDNKYIQKMCF